MCSFFGFPRYEGKSHDTNKIALANRKNDAGILRAGYLNGI